MTPDDMDKRANELIATGAIWQVLDSWVGTLEVSGPVENTVDVRFDFLAHPYRITVTMLGDE